MEGDGTQCIHSMAQSEGKTEVGREDEDIFVFYNLKVDPPAKFFSRLGDEAMVTTDQAQAIQYFIYSMWPVVSRIYSNPNRFYRFIGAFLLIRSRYKSAEIYAGT